MDVINIYQKLTLMNSHWHFLNPSSAPDLRQLGIVQHSHQLLAAVCRWNDGQWTLCTNHNFSQCRIGWVIRDKHSLDQQINIYSSPAGQHPSLDGNSKAVATVTAIIDGTGSFGAAVGPMLAGIISTGGSWNNVIFMVAISEAFAILLLVRLVRREFEPVRRNVRIE